MSNCTTTKTTMTFRHRYVCEFTTTAQERLAQETQFLRDEFVGATLPAGTYDGKWLDSSITSEWECYGASAVSEFGDPTLPKPTDYTVPTGPGNPGGTQWSPNPPNCQVCADGYNYAIEPSSVPWVNGGFTDTGNGGFGSVSIIGELYCQHVTQNKEAVVKVLRHADVEYRELQEGQNRTLVSTASCPCVYP